MFLLAALCSWVPARVAMAELDRVYATFVFERANWALAFKPWFWTSQERDVSDNPDIDEYMGHGAFRAVYGRNGHVVSEMLRNQLESGFDRGALELSWSFPVFGHPYSGVTSSTFTVTAKA